MYLFFKAFLLFLSNFPLKSKVLRSFRQCVFSPQILSQDLQEYISWRWQVILELLAEVGSNKFKTQA